MSWSSRKGTSVFLKLIVEVSNKCPYVLASISLRSSDSLTLGFKISIFMSYGRDDSREHSVTSDDVREREFGQFQLSRYAIKTTDDNYHPDNELCQFNNHPEFFKCWWSNLGQLMMAFTEIELNSETRLQMSCCKEFRLLLNYSADAWIQT